MSKRTQTTEQTGKVWKLQQALAVLMLIAATVVGVLNHENNELMAVAALMWFVGVAWIIVVRIGIWWFHG